MSWDRVPFLLLRRARHCHKVWVFGVNSKYHIRRVSYIGGEKKMSHVSSLACLKVSCSLFDRYRGCVIKQMQRLLSLVLNSACHSPRGACFALWSSGCDVPGRSFLSSNAFSARPQRKPSYLRFEKVERIQKCTVAPCTRILRLIVTGAYLGQEQPLPIGNFE